MIYRFALSALVGYPFLLGFSHPSIDSGLIDPADIVCEGTPFPAEDSCEGPSLEEEVANTVSRYGIDLGTDDELSKRGFLSRYNTEENALHHFLDMKFFDDSVFVHNGIAYAKTYFRIHCNYPHREVADCYGVYEYEYSNTQNLDPDYSRSNNFAVEHKPILYYSWRTRCVGYSICMFEENLDPEATGYCCKLLELNVSL